MRIIGPHILLQVYSIDSTGPCMHLCLKTKILTCMHAIRSPPAIQPINIRRVQIYKKPILGFHTCMHAIRSPPTIQPINIRRVQIYKKANIRISLQGFPLMLLHIRYNWIVLIQLFPDSRNTLHVAGICTLQRFQVMVQQICMSRHWNVLDLRTADHITDHNYYTCMHYNSSPELLVERLCMHTVPAAGYIMS